MPPVVGLLHPGEMGASLGAILRARGVDVAWAAEGRSAATRARAEAADLREVATRAELVRGSDLILSVCPPGEARPVAEEVFASDFAGTYVDANAVSPSVARAIAALAERSGAIFVDGGLIGPPARQPGTTSLVLSGPARGRAEVAALFETGPLDVVGLDAAPGRASALKMAYAAYTKGHAALLLATRALARGEGVEQALLDQWARSHPRLAQVSEGTARGTAPKAWRFEAEMREIAATFSARELPVGFHEAAAEVYGRLAGFRGESAPDLEAVLDALAGGSASEER